MKTKPQIKRSQNAYYNILIIGLLDHFMNPTIKMTIFTFVGPYLDVQFL